MLTDAIPRNWMLVEVLGLSVFDMVRPLILPFMELTMFAPPTPGTRSLPEIDEMALVTSFFCMLP